MTRLMSRGALFQPAMIALALLALGLVPLAASNTLVNFLTTVLIISIAAQGWNVLAGYGGQFSFGHAAFFGTGAYAIAILQTSYGLNPWLALPLAATLGAGVGFVIGFLSFRANLRGSYFALVTLAFAEVLRILANASAVTGGAAGLLIPLGVRPSNLQFEGRAGMYWLALAFVGAVLVMTWLLERGRLGAQLVAVRENEEAARALGVDALRVKLKAITLSGGVTALAGCLYAQNFLYLDANIAYGPWISIDALLAPIIGGVGTVFGPLVGAIALLGLGEMTKGIAGRIPGIDLAVYGALLVVAVAFAPSGILGLLRGKWRGRP